MEKLFILRHILVVIGLIGSTAFAAETNEAYNEALKPKYDPQLLLEYNPTPSGISTETLQQMIAPQSSQPVIAPVILRPTQKNPDAAVGAIMAEPTPQSADMLNALRQDMEQLQQTNPPSSELKEQEVEEPKDARNALEIVQDELRAQQMIEASKHEKTGVLRSTTKRFPGESMTFFVAIGLVTYNSMWIKSHGDPLAMEKHILSLKDPIAHMSFYSFMLANGFYIDLKSKNMDPLTKAQMMKRLSYQGMAVGSLASSIVSDLGHSGQMCVDLWILGKNDKKSHDACDQAWKHWTMRNKFQQYFPQIIAMWASQAATEFADANIRKGFRKLTTTEMAKKFLSRKVLVDQAFKITGADMALTFAGGTWKIKLLRWVGKATQFTGFVAVDHALSPFTYRPLNNILQPALFDFDALAINNLMNAANLINWNDSHIDYANRIVCTVHDPNCFETKLVSEIENFGMKMQQWRDHLNSDAETDMAGWMEMTKKILNQMDYAYKFYQSFVSNMFETLNIGSRIQSGELESTAAAIHSRFPFRKLPLYGVGIGDYKATSQFGKESQATEKEEAPSTEKAEKEKSVLNTTVADMYLLSTSELENKQKEHINKVVANAEKVMSTLTGASKEKAQKIFVKLKSLNVDEVGAGLIDINQILGVNSIQDPTNKKSLYSDDFMKFIANLRKEIGNPLPVVYNFAGFSQAFATNTAMATIVPEAGFSLWSLRNKYMFNKESDLMIYKIFCGEAQGGLEKHTFKLFFGEEQNMLSPQFNPPRLLTKSKDLENYCSQWRKTRELKIFTENLYGQNIGQSSMYAFFIANFNYNVIGDFKNKENAKTFDKWWLENGRKSMNAEFKNYDDKFKVLADITYKNIFDQKGFYNWFVDKLNQSKYLKSNIKENLQFETNFYLQIIARALDADQVAAPKDKHAFLEKISKSATAETFTSVTGATKGQAQIQKVLDLFNSYYAFIQDGVKFDQYIAHSKKIDTAINDILVLGGLKTSKTGKAIIACSTAFTAQPTVEKSETPTEELSLIDLPPEDQSKLTATVSASGTENTNAEYKDVVGQSNLRQKAITAAVQGLRLVESEIRRFIRMKIVLSRSLEIDAQEFKDLMLEMNEKTPGKLSTPTGANPFGQRGGG